MTQGIDRRTLLIAVPVATFSGRIALGQDCSVSVAVDYGRWPDLKPWIDELRPNLSAWWSIINRALGSPACQARSFGLALVKIEPDRIAAAAVGDRILINAPYVLANRYKPDMLRMIAHELVHVAQAYPTGAHPAWLTEGIADYVRYYVLFPDDPGRAFDPSQEDWREDYSPAAGLLSWVELKWPGAVSSINSARRTGRDGQRELGRVTRREPGDLWRGYLSTKPEAASAQKRRAYWDSLKQAS